jgi:hypothetical protein
MTSNTVGPFNRGDFHRLSYEGFDVPYVVAQQMDKDNPENWYLGFDNRIFFGPCTKEVIDSMIGPLAVGMAIAAGYPCPGATEKINKHAVRLRRMNSQGVRTIAKRYN